MMSSLIINNTKYYKTTSLVIYYIYSFILAFISAFIFNFIKYFLLHMFIAIFNKKWV